MNVLCLTEASNLAVHGLAYLAALPEGDRATASTIAAALGVSESHLGKVLQRLVGARLVHSIRGVRGGFEATELGRGASVLEVVEHMEGGLAGPRCLLGTPICHRRECLLASLHAGITALVREHLGALTMGDFGIEPLRTGAP